MLLVAWVLGGVLLGVLIRDIRRAVVLMIVAWVGLAAVVLIVGRHQNYPLADNAGVLGVVIIGILATVAGHRMRRLVWTRVFRRP